MKNTIRRFFLILRAALGVVLLYYVLKKTGGLTTAKQLISAKWLLPWLSALTILGAAFESKRLGVLFGAQGMRLSFVEGYRAVAIAALFNFCIPGGTGGDVTKLYYLAADSRGRRVEIATLIFVDRAVALFCMLSLVVALALLDGRLVWDYPLIGSWWPPPRSELWDCWCAELSPVLRGCARAAGTLICWTGRRCADT